MASLLPRCADKRQRPDPRNSGDEVARYNRLAAEVNSLIREATIGDKLPGVWAAPLGFKYPQESWESYRQKALQFRQDGVHLVPSALRKLGKPFKGMLRVILNE